MTKDKTIKAILKLTKKSGEEYFDSLYDRSDEYLTKLKTVITGLKK